MSTEIDRVDVVATPIFSGDRWLLVYNDRWKSFTLPMTKLRRLPGGSDASPIRWETGVSAALRNVAECLHRTTTRPPALLLDFPALSQSDQDGLWKHFAFQIYGFGVEQPAAGTGVIAEWLTASEILDPDRQPISPTAGSLVRALQEASLSRRGAFPPDMTAAASRTSVSSVAICSRHQQGQKQWLVQWNEKWQRYFLVGGHADERELPEQCMRRELHEELRLEHQAHYEFFHRKTLAYEAWSASSWEMTRYQITAFDVELTPAAADKFSNDPANRWLTSDEIRSERCHDDKLVSPTARAILAEIDEIHV